MEILQSLPQFYQSPVALDSSRHACLGISPSPTGFSFAAKAQSVILAGVEFFEAGREFPIIFSQTENGRMLPVALLGLEREENLFVDGQGGWQGSYIPAYIRRYPFINTEGGTMAVCFDEFFDGFNAPESVPLFQDGGPSQKLKEITEFLKDYYQQMKRTEELGALLAQAGLLKQIDAQVNLNDGRSFALNGMLVVDEERLNMLPDVDLVRLFRSGMMALIHAHLLSLKSFGALLERKARRGAAAPVQEEAAAEAVAEAVALAEAEAEAAALAEAEAEAVELEAELAELEAEAVAIAL